ncbi:protein DEFECTIVE IN MERISTEM SILENCING 3-like [Solanum lycopersicum]|uniref:protein DEFECTIVE IN MERISTEM SILENCING 3-like n=1 Tax=Solanum lycopersicum TaxID=4081 RepID=UPI0008FEC7F0|nr:protein DEFECTIVE IN MERISTEM SILENCING 3-like [Solanum lycopersicum]
MITSAEYLGLETMLAVVCKTHDGLKALLTSDKKGPTNTSSRLHGVGSSIGGPLHRYLVICLENLMFEVMMICSYKCISYSLALPYFLSFSFLGYHFRPYTGEFIADDPKRRLAIRRKPRYVNKETSPGFLGFAVNMINIDTANLYCVISNGHVLRETLFSGLVAQLQVYKTRADMMQALPFITNGDISLDGGIIKSGCIFSLGKR